MYFGYHMATVRQDPGHDAVTAGCSSHAAPFGFASGAPEFSDTLEEHTCATRYRGRPRREFRETGSPYCVAVVGQRPPNKQHWHRLFPHQTFERLLKASSSEIPDAVHQSDSQFTLFGFAVVPSWAFATSVEKPHAYHGMLITLTV